MTFRVRLRRTTAGFLAGAVVAAAALGAVLWAPATASAEPSLDEARSQVKQLTTKMRNANENVNRARDELEASQKRQEELEAGLGDLRRRHDETSAEVGKLGAAAYQNGGNISASGIFSSGSPVTMLDQLSYIEVLNAENSKTLREFDAAAKKLRETKEGIDAEVKQREETSTSAEKQKQALQADFDTWKKLRDKLSPKDAREDGVTGVCDGSASGNAAAAVKYAYAQLGKPYVFGAAGPGSFDCSGLTQMAWRQAGVSLPHSARQQWSMLGSKVSLNSLAPGDLVFFFGGVSHVGIYVGGGNMIHSPQPGQSVKLGKIRTNGMPIKGAARPG
ncbi:MAG: NlpC/P60 family protein [Mycobacteriales bacterium]